jgi:ABC-2 type transport system ATP-binding protein
MKKVIEVEHLVKFYGNLRAVNDISFDVYAGEIFTLVGPNGAGKTTTTEILECIKTPTSGTVKVLGMTVPGDEEKIKRRIGVIPQEFNAFERLTVRENVKLIADIYGVKEDIRRYLEMLGLWESRDKKFRTLSGGMKRRVGICMAVVSNPEILFLDEPTTGLDPEARRETWDVIRKLKKSGKTIFLTTHYMEEAEKLSDRVAMIMNGRIVAIGKVKELIEKHGGGFKVLSGEKVVGMFATRREAARCALQLYEQDKEAEMIEPSMDDVFLNLVHKKINERGELL